MRRRPTKSPYRRAALAGLALTLLSAPAIGSGCAASFTPISEVDSLRVLAVEVDKPYAAPGDDVKFKMTFHDGFVDPAAPDAGPRKVNVVWFGGCFDPLGDQYYACYEQLAAVFADLQAGGGGAIESGLVGLGNEFTLKLPTDLISRRPEPAAGLDHYGLAFVFFAACAGTIGPAVPVDGGGAAGSFPLGCFDDSGNQLDARSFVPGFTQVYAFADERPNSNPKVDELTLDDKKLPGIFDEPRKVKRCDVSAEARREPPSCGKSAPVEDCRGYDIDIVAPKDIDDLADLDLEGESSEGKPLREVVWVDYFADKGDFESAVKLVSDATTGLLDDHGTVYTPPAEPGLVNVWAVVHDARGGQVVVHRMLLVE